MRPNMQLGDKESEWKNNNNIKGTSDDHDFISRISHYVLNNQYLTTNQIMQLLLSI